MPETTKDRLREKDNAKREAGGQKADVDAAVDAAQQVDLAAAARKNAAKAGDVGPASVETKTEQRADKPVMREGEGLAEFAARTKIWRQMRQAAQDRALNK